MNIHQINKIALNCSVCHLNSTSNIGHRNQQTENGFVETVNCGQLNDEIRNDQYNLNKENRVLNYQINHQLTFGMNNLMNYAPKQQVMIDQMNAMISRPTGQADYEANCHLNSQIRPMNNETKRKAQIDKVNYGNLFDFMY